MIRLPTRGRRKRRCPPGEGSSESPRSMGSFTPSAASSPTQPQGLGVTAINSILDAVGGDQNASGGTVRATVEAYDPSTDSWTTKASMPTARWGLGVAAINGVLYAIGGVNNGIRTEVEAYSP